MLRQIDSYLTHWKEKDNRKVLLLRGARQVGKTYAARTLAKQFESFVEVNFEEDRDVMAFFSGSLSPETLLRKLAGYYGQDIIPGKTLLFFDEIQSCPDALRSLRFFHEKTPDLHVIATGSLLEFALQELPSFGVGRIQPMFMHPMSFMEYLDAMSATPLKELLQSASLQNPLDEVLHKKVLEHYKNFQFIGGFPDVVQAMVDTQRFSECQQVLDGILTTFQDDFAKYKKRGSVLPIQETFESIPHQVGNKFKYSNIVSESTGSHLKQCLELLCLAGLAYKVLFSAAQGTPLGGQVNHKHFKVILCDPGLHNRLTQLDLGEYLVTEDFDQINKGHLAETFVGTELMAYSSPFSKNTLYYWQRDSRGSQAEVDYLFQKQQSVIPIEVKSGSRGKIQSLRLFMQTHPQTRGIRYSLENFNAYPDYDAIPIYMVHQLGQ